MQEVCEFEVGRRLELERAVTLVAFGVTAETAVESGRGPLDRVGRETGDQAVTATFHILHWKEKKLSRVLRPISLSGQ